MNTTIKKLALAGGLILSANTAMADIITFGFTGRLTVIDPTGQILANPDSPDAIDAGGYQTAIKANLTYNTDLGVGSSDLAFDLNFWDAPVSIHDISLNFIEGTNDIEGTMLADWSGTTDMKMQILWDATGLFNAIDSGLQAGDRISGTNLYRDLDGDGYAETFITDVNSATPYTDAFASYNLNQGPAPLATKEGTLGLIDGPFPGVKVLLDIGSGNSMYVTSVSTVPVPAAFWLFGSGLIGLAGFMRRKQRA